MMQDYSYQAQQPADVARAALVQLSEAQRLALAIEIVNGAVQTSSVFHLIRLERTAATVVDQLSRSKFIEEETKTCL
ncbi:hypothetical protein JQX09_24300 [Sulfitobacter pseudonitzschiae]|uniref:Uncharacterized protein n=1 Tax=Pseudosulfitobacter pseudonitzschiae TaxID=1402135 RepID=A0A9Q2NN41_9RHOB|nr:hypothetical protein [Pseudosulfitobacter pseudonitzschiae]MBM2295045.1 hypothetical protein [Pseudosulfitobacter pseudonitzschiae]MBM2299959.1 hypothetical protein [Pseudosulfitobacter pseudonitzschiae]MBM2304883.1 hypothetical protein [Pseudosulfitobacter pseudonitzschiae]MBM2314656.1 hypothetical protein [Pseudosulfitobacter pseudonitzschiae]MBM2319566.1 hypothetical protein [Pseudosulfitobacter pseudonitzschiae]